MPLFARKQYVRVWREINFNSHYKVNADYNETLRDHAHWLISFYLSPTK